MNRFSVGFAMVFTQKHFVAHVAFDGRRHVCARQEVSLQNAYPAEEFVADVARILR